MAFGVIVTTTSLAVAESKSTLSNPTPARAITRKSGKLFKIWDGNLVPLAIVAENPSGEGTIESYTVMCDRDGKPSRGIIIGRLSANNERFVANLPRVM